MTKTRLRIITIAVCAVLNLGLALLKLYIGLATNSVAIYSDSINNFLDVITSLVGIVAICFVYRKSKKYPYGLGRIEYLAGFVIALATVLVGVGFCYSSIGRIMYPQPVGFSWVYFALVAVSFLIKLGMGFTLTLINKKADTDVVKAIALDSFTDSGVTFIALVSFVTVRLAGLRLDGSFGLVIGVIVLVFGIKLLLENSSRLLGATDKELVDELLHYLSSLNVDYSHVAVHDYGKEARAITITVSEYPDTEVVHAIKSKYGENITFYKE